MAGGRDPALSPGEIDDGEAQEIDDGIDEDVLDDGQGEPEGEDGSSTDPGADGGEDEDPDARQGQTRDVGRQGRGRDTIRNLRQRAQEAERTLAAERDATNRRFAELETRIGQRQPSAADLAREEAEEQARVELMSPAQVARYFAEKSERRIAQALQGQQFQVHDRIDKQAFEAQVQANPLLARVAPKVEQVLQQERAAGRNTDRIIVAKYLLGDEMLSRRNSQLPRQRAGAQRRVAGQTTRPAGGAGDGQRQNGRQGDDSYEAAMRRARGVNL